jgi:hypothetical protein
MREILKNLHMMNKGRVMIKEFVFIQTHINERQCVKY